MKPFTSLLLLGMVTLAAAEVEIPPYETGVGARAFALANNHTALSAGVSDLYWNPGALSFSVTREFQASLYGVKLIDNTDFFGNSSDDDLQRFRLGNAGFSFALPTNRGGMSFAASYSNPITLDDIADFSGTYELNDSIVDVRERTGRTTGNLNFWTIGFGIQIAHNLGLGIATSIVSGKSTTDFFLDKYITHPATSFSTYDNYQSEGNYFGYDIRAGIFYKTERLQTGVRLVLPRLLRYDYLFQGIADDTLYDYTDKYAMYSSYSGSWGVSVLLPYVTVTTEVRTTLPYDYLFPIEKIPDDCQAGYFKSGAGIGIEVPLVVAPAIVRVGYSCDEVDLHPWMYDYLENGDFTGNVADFYWSDDGMKVNRLLHKISCGIGFTTATTSLDIAYGFSTWGITTRRNLEQTYYHHRVLASFAVRF
jgi:hypothetical protein